MVETEQICHDAAFAQSHRRNWRTLAVSWQFQSMANSSNAFYETLARANLEKFYNNFVSRGISHIDTLASLTMQEYGAYAVTAMEDRKKLFALIQSLKNNAIVTASIQATKAQPIEPIAIERQEVEKESLSNSPKLQRPQLNPYGVPLGKSIEWQ